MMLGFIQALLPYLISIGIPVTVGIAISKALESGQEWWSGTSPEIEAKKTRDKAITEDRAALVSELLAQAPHSRRENRAMNPNGNAAMTQQLEQLAALMSGGPFPKMSPGGDKHASMYPDSGDASELFAKVAKGMRPSSPKYPLSTMVDRQRRA